MSTRARIVAVLACTFAFVFPARSIAQVVRSGEVSGGYAFLNDPTEQLKFPSGWTVGAAAGLNGWLSIAADAGGHYKTIPLVDGTLTLRTHTLLGGFRVSTRIGPLVGFAQMLAGISHGGGTAFGSSDSVSHLAWQPGAGVDVPVGARAALRAEFDRRSLADSREYRLVAAFAFKWRRQ